MASLSTVCAVARDVPWIRRVNPVPCATETGAGVSILAPPRRGLRIPYATPFGFLTRGAVGVSPSRPEAASAVHTWRQPLHARRAPLRPSSPPSNPRRAPGVRLDRQGDRHRPASPSRIWTPTTARKTGEVERIANPLCWSSTAAPPPQARPRPTSRISNTGQSGAALPEHRATVLANRRSSFFRSLSLALMSSR